MYQFDLAAEQLSTDLMLSPSSNSPIQMQLEMSLEKRRGISCAVPPSPITFLAQKAREKLERQSVHKREKREAVCRDFWLLPRKRTTGIAGLRRDNWPPFCKALEPLVQYGMVSDTGHGTAAWTGHVPDTAQSLEERSRILPTTSHTQLSYLHLKSSCIKILRCSRSVRNNGEEGLRTDRWEGDDREKVSFNALVFGHIWLAFFNTTLWERHQARLCTGQIFQSVCIQHFVKIQSLQGIQIQAWKGLAFLKAVWEPQRSVLLAAAQSFCTVVPCRKLPLSQPRTPDATPKVL